MAAGKLTIVEPWAATALVSSVGGDTGVANLLKPDPKEIMQASSAAARYLTFDLGAARSVDSFFIGFTNATDATMRPHSATDAAGSGPVALAAAQTIRAADCATVRSSRLITLAAPVVGRYFRIDLSANAGGALQIGIAAVGRSFSAEWDREWGSGRRLVDTSKVTQLLSGGFGRQRGARKAAYSWTFGDLTDAETEALWAMQLRLGISDPLVVAERDGVTVGANEQLHYGLFTRVDAFERREPQVTKWSLTIEEWT